MKFYEQTFDLINSSLDSPWLGPFKEKVKAGFNQKRWGDLSTWHNIYMQLPLVEPSGIDLDQGHIRIGQTKDLESRTITELEDLLYQLRPWRKGPFDVFGIRIDTEWRSDLKWDRLKNHIEPLEDRFVLDVGCGNGYHCLRAYGQGAKLVLGIDPTLLYVYQYLSLQKYINEPAVTVFPVGIDDMPDNISCFDTVFSMGLIYHRRSPFDHLLQLKSFLRDGGELVLESLVIDGQEGEVLTPGDRYAKMPNVWFIPTPKTLENWLKRMGYKNIRLVDVNKTTIEEQHVTKWMEFHSLENFLDPADPNITVEGYPAPQRAIFLANK